MTETKTNSVLIVDDENMNIIALMNILDSEYTVYSSTDGQDAIEAAEEFLPDIILLDVVMPEMDGYAVITALKKSEKTKDIPVIFITGLSDAENEKKGLALGALDYITKPFTPEIVKLRVHNQMKMLEQIHLLTEKEIVEQNSRVRMDFLSRMSHELLTPMNAIIGMLPVLRMTDDPDDMEMYHEKIDEASRHLLKLIHDLLDVSGTKEGAFKLENSPFALRAVIRNVLDKLGGMARKKQQSLDFNLASVIRLTLIGDAERLAQVITNLLSNAIAFTPENGQIGVSARVVDEENETITLQFEVSDNGIGISQEQQSSIFKLFEQVDESVTRKHGGVGLGLAVSKRIIEMMDGAIWLESELGKGSKFTFTCKMKKAAGKEI